MQDLPLWLGGKNEGGPERGVRLRCDPAFDGDRDDAAFHYGWDAALWYCDCCGEANVCRDWVKDKCWRCGQARGEPLSIVEKIATARAWPFAVLAHLRDLRRGGAGSSTTGGRSTVRGSFIAMPVEVAEAPFSERFQLSWVGARC